MIKQTIKSLLPVLVGLAAGFLGGLSAFYYFFGKINIPGNNLNPPAITERKEITIQENKALKDAAAKVGGIAASIKITNSKGVAIYGSGLIFTSDGMVALPYSLFPPQSEGQITAAGKVTAFKVLKRDKAQNLVILKLEGANWPTASFYQFENLKLGERIFLEGAKAGGGNFVNEGVVRDFDSNSINTTIIEKVEAQGAPAFDIEGNILGIALLDKTGQASLIPIWAIKSFAGL